MKKTVYLYFLSGLLLYTLNAQEKGVGIGTDTPHTSALLDVDASSLPANGKKGLLTPHVALLSRTDVVTVANPAVGLLVFNTTASATDTTIEANTFYFWNGTEWIDVATSENIRAELFPQVFIVGNTGNQNFNKTNFNNGTSFTVNFNPTATGAMVVDVGNRILLSDNRFKVLSAGRYEITGYVGYNPWVSTTCTNTTTTESACVAGLDFIVQRSVNNGVSWTNIAKSSAVWGVGTGDRNRSVIVAPFVISLNENDLIRAVVIKGSTTNHGTSPTDSTLSIEAGTGLAYSRLIRFQKLD